MNKSKEYEKKKKSEKGTGRQDPERKWYKTNSWKQCAFKWNDLKSGPEYFRQPSQDRFTSWQCIDLRSKSTNHPEHCVQYPVGEQRNMTKNKLNLKVQEFFIKRQKQTLKKSECTTRQKRDNQEMPSRRRRLK